MRLFFKTIKYLITGFVAIVILLAIVLAVGIFGPGVWSSIRGEPDYSVTLREDASPITDRFDVFAVTGEDGTEHQVILPRAQPPLPPPNRFLTGPGAQVAQNAEQVLRSGGIPADAYVVQGANTGEPVMIISMDLSQGRDSLLPTGGRGVETTINELLQVARREGVDVTAVAVVLHDEEGDPVVAISTSADEVRAFRDGEITMEEAMDHLGISLVDRAAIIDLLTGLRTD